MLLHVLIVVKFCVMSFVICMTCCSGADVGHLWLQCTKREVGGVQAGACSCIDVL
jgi:hypothetical protein